MRRRPRMATFALIAAATVGCVAESTSPPTTVGYDSTPRAMEDIECEELLTTEEIGDALSGEFQPLGKRQSSCYWLGGGQLIQVVIKTGDISDWKSLILEEYDVRIEERRFELWEDPTTGSLAAFGPERGLLLHGVADQAAASALLALAIARL